MAVATLHLLFLNLGLLVALVIVQEPKLPIRGNLTNGHHSRMEGSIRSSSSEQDSLVFTQESSEIGEFLVERWRSSRGFGILIVS